MLCYIKKIKDLDLLEEGHVTVVKHTVGELEIKKETSVGKSIDLEEDVVVVKQKKKKLK